MIRRAFLFGFLLLFGTAFGLLVAACGADKSTSTTSTARTETTSALALPKRRLRFASFSAKRPIPSTAQYGGPATPHTLENVRVAPAVRKAIGRAGVAKKLTEQGFALVPSDLHLFHFAYQGNVYDGWPVFVTADVAYHEWHLAFDKLLRSLEQEVLLPKLETLVAGLLLAAQTQTVEAAGSPVAETASRVEQLYQVAAAELGISAPLGPLAKREKALVDAHSNPRAESPILGTELDYSLFTPRGHYTRNADLRRFFVTMSVLGQSNFCTIDCVEQSRMGILASRILVRDPRLLGLWREIYEPTAFLVGVADDYTPLEVAAAARDAVQSGLADATAFRSDATVQAVVDALTSARPVLINPDRAGIRIMGTRFVVDSFILDQLLYPHVGTAAKPRLIPSALDLAAAFGSGFAYRVLDGAGETAYANYDAQLAALRKAVAERPPRDWGATVYDAWLYAIAPMFAAHRQAFPDFMRTDAWSAKAHQAGLGSYAELKHDTILFTKQAVAEGGDDLPIPPRRNWVEPEPVAFERLAAVADLTRRGLRDRGLLTQEQAGLLQAEIGLFQFLGRIARDELNGEPISQRANKRLTQLGGELESIYWRTSDRTATALPEADQQAAIVADIASSPNGVLEVGTGRIDRIYVLVPDDAGRSQVAVGGVYSYYEFTNPPGERLTDEAWRELLDRGKAPARPAWEEVALAR